MAASFADEVLRTSAHQPMWAVEANATLAVVAARGGDLEQAVTLGEGLLSKDRQSRPSFGLVAAELGHELRQRYGGEPVAKIFVERVRAAAG